MDIEKLIEDYKDDIIKSTQEIVRIKSVEEKETYENAPFGKGPREALDYVIDLSERLGFEVTDFDGFAAHADLGEGEETVGILAHVDVVPEGDGWDYPPYAAEIHDGKIYGRGTMDDKGPAIAAMYAMKILKDMDVDLSRKIRIIFGANEETGWRCMDHYFSVEEAPDMAFTPDANFPVIFAEKGILIFNLEYPIENNEEVISLKAGNAANMVPEWAEVRLKNKNKDYKKVVDKFIEKGYDLSIKEDDSEVLIRAEGKSAHGSTPEIGINAIAYLMPVLEELLDENNSIKEFASLYNEKIGFTFNGENLGCGLEDEVSGKLNLNAGVLKIEDGKVVLTINIRYPINSNAKEVYDGIRENLSASKFILIEGSDQKPLYVPEDNFLVEKLMDVYREEMKDDEAKPVTTGGGTYARAMKNAVAFGPVFPGQVELAHQKNEFIEIDHLLKLVSIYTKALYSLAK